MKGYLNLPNGAVINLEGIRYVAKSIRESREICGTAYHFLVSYDTGASINPGFDTKEKALECRDVLQKVLLTGSIT